MSVIIEPSVQLEFHGPFSRISKESLHVKNPGTEAVIFKVKTTAPKQYCVRPNAGRIEPNSEIEVQIILQPIKEQLPDDYKCKDKFLVQTAPIHPSIEQQDITSMWSHIETTERASMHQHKIKCVFVPAAKEEEEEHSLTEETVPAVVVNEEKNNAATAAPIPEQVNSTGIASSNSTSSTTTRDIVPPVPAHRETSIPTVTPVTAASPAASAATATTANTSSPAAATVPSTHAPAAAESIVPESSIKSPTQAPPTVAAAVLPTPATAAPVETQKPRDIVVPSGDNNKEKELKEALEKIKLLEKQLSELQQGEGLRARSNNNTNTSGGRKLASTVQPLDAVHQHLAALEKPRADEGYPPQVVLIVAVLVFIFTYLFF